MNFPNIFGGKRQKVTITTVNIKLHNYMHSMVGMEVKDKTFAIDIPFRNKTHTNLLTAATDFKAEKAKPIVIRSIDVGEPFRLVSVSPVMPVEISADEKVDFKLTLEPPSHNYTGPLGISFISDNVETVHIEISKTILNFGGKKTTIETSSRIMTLPKGQIFAEKVQLYKAMSFGDTASRIELEPPFKFVSSEPKLPLKIDDTNSYILEIYIQAPDSPYAGPLEIKLS